MARALLRITTVRLAEAAGIDKNTVVAIEAGRRGRAGPIKKLQEYFEGQGVVFIRGIEKLHQPTVALLWDVEPPSASAGGETSSPDEREGNLDAAAWDEEEVGPRERQEIDLDELRRYWARETDKWQRLSEPSRKALANRIGQLPISGAHH
jgi:transcriptional regulator with XRE-family HTH domain